jgi:hypothetical protein
MNIVASFFGLGMPELAFLLTVVVVAALIFLVVKGFMKGYAGNKK